MKFIVDSKALRAMREERGMSRNALARRAILSEQRLYELEREDQEALETTIERLSASLGVEPTAIAPDYVPPIVNRGRVSFDGDRLRDMRLERGMTRTDAARHSKLDESTIRKMERVGSAWPETIHKLAKAYNVSPAYICPLLAKPPRYGERELLTAAGTPPTREVPRYDPELESPELFNYLPKEKQDALLAWISKNIHPRATPGPDTSSATTPNEDPKRFAKSYAEKFAEDLGFFAEEVHEEFRRYAEAELAKYDQKYDTLKAHFLADFHAARERERRQREAAEREAALAETRREEHERGVAELERELEERKRAWGAGGGSEAEFETAKGRIKEDLLRAKLTTEAERRRRAADPRSYL